VPKGQIQKPGGTKIHKIKYHGIDSPTSKTSEGTRDRGQDGKGTRAGEKQEGGVRLGLGGAGGMIATEKAQQ